MVEYLFSHLTNEINLLVKCWILRGRIRYFSREYIYCDHKIAKLIRLVSRRDILLQFVICFNSLIFWRARTRSAPPWKSALLCHFLCQHMATCQSWRGFIGLEVEPRDVWKNGVKLTDGVIIRGGNSPHISILAVGVIANSTLLVWLRGCTNVVPKLSLF